MSIPQFFWDKPVKITAEVGGQVYKFYMLVSQIDQGWDDAWLRYRPDPYRPFTLPIDWGNGGETVLKGSIRREFADDTKN